MTEAYQAGPGDGGRDTEEQVFAGASVIGAGRAQDGAEAGHGAVDDTASTAAGSVVEQALTALDGLDDHPPAAHVERFEHVHEVLRAHLSGDA